MLKTCTKCKKPKPLSEFSRHCRWSDGLQKHCKACVAASRKRWYQKNREQRIEMSCQWIEQNRDRFNATARKNWQKKYPEIYFKHRRKIQRLTRILSTGYISGLLRAQGIPVNDTNIAAKRRSIAVYRTSQFLRLTFHAQHPGLSH